MNNLNQMRVATNNKLTSAVVKDYEFPMFLFTYDGMAPNMIRKEYFTISCFDDKFEFKLSYDTTNNSSLINSSAVKIIFTRSDLQSIFDNLIMQDDKSYNPKMDKNSCHIFLLEDDPKRGIYRSLGLDNHREDACLYSFTTTTWDDFKNLLQRLLAN